MINPYFIFFVALIGLGSFADAQVPVTKKEDSKLALAVAKTGSGIKKTSEPLGSFQGLGYFFVTVEDLLSGSKTKGLHVLGGVGYTHLLNHAYVDYDELKNLLNILEIIRDERMNKNTMVNYMFNSKGGFHIDQGWNVDGSWYMYAYCSDKEESVIVIRDISDVLFLISIVQKAIIK